MWFFKDCLIQCRFVRLFEIFDRGHHSVFQMQVIFCIWSWLANDQLISKKIKTKNQFCWGQLSISFSAFCSLLSSQCRSFKIFLSLRLVFTTNQKSEYIYIRFEQQQNSLISTLFLCYIYLQSNTYCEVLQKIKKSY